MSFIIIWILTGGIMLGIWLFLALYPYWKDWKNTRLENVLVDNRNN